MTNGMKMAGLKLALMLAALPVLGLAYETGPPPGYTGAPGDNGTCINSGCHVGAANSGSGNVKIGLPAGNSGTYVPGQAMQILVQITDASKAAYGFELTARMGSGNTAQAGDFITTDANTQVECLDGPKVNGKTCSTTFPVEYIEHNLTGYEASTKASPKGAYTYSFNWTPPAAGSGTVTLYVAANCGQGDPPVVTPTNVYTSKITLTQASATPVPSIFAGGVGPIYSKATTIQPGSWISIYGSNLVSSLGVWNGSPPTPVSLGGASVTIDGKPAYLWVAVPGSGGNPDQLNVQAPDDTATGTVSVVVTNTSNGAATSTVTLGAVGPSFSVLGDAANHAAAIIYTAGGYDIDGPAGTSLGYPTRPVKAGETISLFGVGFGPLTTSAPSGQPYAGADSLTPDALKTLQLLIGGVPVPAANISFAGLAGQGLYQLNVLVPAGLGTGDKTLSASVLGVTTPSGVVLAVQ